MLPANHWPTTRLQYCATYKQNSDKNYLAACHLVRAFFEMFGLAWKRSRRVTGLDEPVFGAAGFWLAPSAAVSGCCSSAEVVLLDAGSRSPLAGSGDEAQTAATGTTIFCDDVWSVIAVDGQLPLDMWPGDSNVQDAVMTLLMDASGDDIVHKILQQTGNNILFIILLYFIQKISCNLATFPGVLRFSGIPQWDNQSFEGRHCA